MFVAAQQLKTLVQRCARNILHAKLSQVHQQQCTQIGNTLMVRFYSSTAPPPHQYKTWTDTEFRSLVDYVSSEFILHGLKPDWEKISSRFGLSTSVCKQKYLTARNMDFKARGTQGDAVFMAKTVFARSRKEISSKHRWTPEESSRLREIKGASKKRISWKTVAQYVGNGLTDGQCLQKWSNMCAAEELASLHRNNNESVSQNKETATAKDRTGNWTPDELAQIKALLDTPTDDRLFHTRSAFQLFPHKPKAQVRLKVKYLKNNIRNRKIIERILVIQQQLRQMVSNYGGVEMADWKEISKQVGVTEFRCQNIYNDMLLVSHSKRYWTADEVDRLVIALRSQKSRKRSFDWHAVANAVKTRSRQQCKMKFRDKRIRQTILHE